MIFPEGERTTDGTRAAASSSAPSAWPCRSTSRCCRSRSPAATAPGRRGACCRGPAASRSPTIRRSHAGPRARRDLPREAGARPRAMPHPQPRSAAHRRSGRATCGRSDATPALFDAVAGRLQARLAARRSARARRSRASARPRSRRSPARENARSCSICRTLARSSAISAVSRASAPGRSRRSTREAHQAAVLHEAALDDAREHGDVDVAAGEHERHACGRPGPSGRLSSAASGAAPAPSTTVFSISSRSRIALASSSSLTVTTSST